MKLRIVAKTTDALEVLYTSAKTCTSEHAPSDIFYVLGDAFEINKNQMIKLVTKVLDSGHMSIAEHVNITFAISEISRACSHQLVRHRHCSFSQQSQRYVNMSDYSLNINDKLLSNIDFKLAIQHINRAYDAMIEEGIPQEDARMVLPSACTTNIVMTCNLRELIHICNERLCVNAQAEIRELVGLMRAETIKRYGWIEKYLAPKCEKYKLCAEYKSCGKYPKGE